MRVAEPDLDAQDDQIHRQGDGEARQVRNRTDHARVQDPQEVGHHDQHQNCGLKSHKLRPNLIIKLSTQNSMFCNGFLWIS